MFAPKHYLSQWHIRYNDDADAKASEEGFESWTYALSAHEGYPIVPPTDLGKPTLNPWRPVSLNPDLVVWERNPYYWRVDPDGNQLPYIDRVRAQVVPDPMHIIRIMEGDVDIAYTGLNLDDYQLLKENEDYGNNAVTLIPGIESASVGVALNLNHPATRRAQLYQDVRIRHALSIAIDREEVNDKVYYGHAVPRQSAPIPHSTYYRTEWGQAYADYDPQRANALLDQIGMKRGADGFRHAPWDEPLQIVLEYPEQLFNGYEVLDLIKEHWERIGIDVSLTPLSSASFSDRHDRRPRTTEGETAVNDHDAVAMAVVGDEIATFMRGAAYHSCFRSHMRDQMLTGDCGGHFDWGSAWGEWIAANNADFSSITMPGNEPPPEIKELDVWTRHWVHTEYGSTEYIKLARNIFDLQAENLWIIGIVGLAPHPLVTNKSLRNVPVAYKPGSFSGRSSFGRRSLAYSADQLYFLQ